MIERSLFEYLLNTLWQLPLLAFATWLVVRIARPSLAIQHTLWIAALLLGVLLPMRGIPATSVGASSLAPEMGVATEPVPPPAFTSPLRTTSFQLTDRTIHWLLELYGVSIAFSLARLVHGFLAARTLAAQAVEHPLTTLESALLNTCAARLNLAPRRIPAVRFLTDPTAGPFVIGIRNPVLLLPESLRPTSAHFSDVELAAVLSHELAHIRRRDFLANLLARAIALPIAYHPATSALQTRIRQTREMICDHHAACSIESPAAYAHSLLAIADRLIQPTRHVEAVGLFDSARDTLEERIVKLTQPAASHSILHSAARITAGTAILTAGIFGATTVHLRPAAPLDPQPVYAAMLQEPAPPQAPAAPARAAEPAPTAALPPTPAPLPAQAPTPDAPKPGTHVRHGIVMEDGEVRDLTPEERARLEAQLNATRDQIRKMKQDLKSHPPIVSIDGRQILPADFDKQIAEATAFANDPEYRRKIEALKVQVNAPEFRKQIEELRRTAVATSRQGPELKLQMDQLQQQLDSPEFHRQIDEAKQQVILCRADTRKQIDEARARIEAARKITSDPKVQQQLDNARKHLDAATKTF